MKKRESFLVLAVMMLLSVLITSCDATQPTETSVLAKNYNTSTNMALSAESLMDALQDGLEEDEDYFDEASILDFRLSDGGYVILWENTDNFFITQLNTSLAVIDNVSMTRDKDQTAYQIVLRNEEPYGFLFQETSENSWDTSYFLTRIEVGSNTMSDPQIINSLSNSFVIDTESDTDGSAYFLAENMLIALSLADGSEEKIFFEEGEKGMCISFDENEGVFVTLSHEANAVVKKYEKNEKRLVGYAELTNTSGIYADDICFLKDNNKNNILISALDGLYDYDMKTQEISIVYTYANLGITSVTPPIRILAGTTTYVWGMLSSSGEIENAETEGLYMVHTSLEEKMKTKITLGVLDVGETSDLEKIISYYNTNNETIEIEMKSYADYSSCITEEDYNQEYKRAKTAFALEIMSSNSPDILLLPPEMIRDLEKDAALEDLNLLLSKDSTINESLFIPAFWKSQENEEGNRSYVCPFVCLSGFLTPAKWNLQNPYSYQEISEIADKNDMKIIDLENSSSMLAMFYPSLQHAFIDFDSRKTDFSGTDFEAFLLWSKEYGAQKAGQTSGSDSVLYPTTIMNFEYFLSRYSSYNNVLDYVGYPDCGDGLIIEEKYLFSISDNSDQKEEAWSFVSFLLSDTVQNMSREWGAEMIPIQISACDNMIANSIKRYKNGKASVVVMDQNQASPIYRELTEEDFEDARKGYLDLIYQAVKTNPSDQNIFTILLEECAPYYEGDKSVKETVDSIQGRVQLYLSEDN